MANGDRADTYGDLAPYPDWMTGAQATPAPSWNAALGMPTVPPPIVPPRPDTGEKTFPRFMAEAAIPHMISAPFELAAGPGRAYQGQMSPEEMYSWGPNMAMMMVGTPGVPAGLGSSIRPIRAYHGSPYDFERFDLSKIGTGEGAQAYGHGLYFAENPAVALDYRNKLAPMPQPGRMYEVNINADPAQFLDWDRPLSQQPQAIRDIYSNLPHAASHKVYEDYLKARGEALPGSGIYRMVQGTEQPIVATAQLREAGIPGIRYLDQGSRDIGVNFRLKQVGGVKTGDWQLIKSTRGGPDEVINRFPTYEQGRIAKDAAYEALNPTRNYVLFRDDIIDILRKYGLIGLPGGLAAMDAVQDNRQ